MPNPNAKAPGYQPGATTNVHPDLAQRPDGWPEGDAWIYTSGASKGNAKPSADIHPDRPPRPDRPPPPKCGDLIQWTINGMDQFPEPEPVRDVSPCGGFVFVDGSRTGIPVAQVSTIRPSRPPSAHIADGDVDAIPPKLIRAKRWVVWKWTWKDDKGKWDKPPIDPESGFEIDQTASKNWMTFFEAHRAALKHGDGIGIALGPADDRLGVVGIDLDGCIDDRGNIGDEARRIVDSFRSYTERTPSGQGLRILIWGDKPGRRCRTKNRPGIELYQDQRYLTVSGRHLEGTPTQIVRRDGPLKALYDEMFGAGARPQGGGNSRPDGHTSTTDDDLIGRARRAKNGAKFTALFDRGDISDYAGDESAADQALANMLAFWLGRDFDRIEAMFGRSALGGRDKWKGRADYRQRTIDLAIDDCAEVYTSRGRRPKSGADGSSANGHGTQGGGAGSRASPGYICGRGGSPIPCANNTKVWLGLNRPADYVRYDRFRQAIVLGESPITDRAVVDLSMEIEASMQAPWSQEHVRSVLVHLAHRRTFSSVVDWLESPRWDGTERIGKFFADHFEGEDNDYSGECARVFFLSAVARAYEPGCQADIMPVLIGSQGIGKSTGMAALCPDADWFADDLGCDLFAGKAAEGLQGKWIFEFGEFARINRSTLDVVKSFITRRVDRYRPPYGRIAQDFPRSCVFFGTTNTEQPLQDIENRRFFPIRVVQGNVPAIKASRDQLWAEAVSRYKAGEKWYITSSHLLAEISSHLELARSEDAWETILREKLEGRDRTTTVEAAELLGLWDDRPQLVVNRLGKPEQTRIGNALAAIGFKRERDKKPPRAYYYQRTSGPTSS
jgi:hypothetical protein